MPCRERWQVNLFLMLAKPLLVDERVQFVHRQKNLETLGRLGFTREQQVQILQGLTPEDYFNTSAAISVGADEAWEFGVAVEGVEIYIKLEIFSGQAEKRLLCWSFHEAEQRIIYPFKS